MNIPETFQIALRHHQAGRLANAETLYRQILAAQPSHSDALHLLGVIGNQVGRHGFAEECIRKAISFDPNNPAAHSNLSNAFSGLGRFDEAIASCRRALQLQSDFPDAHNNLGKALRACGRLDEAIASYRRALELKPDYPDACFNLANALRDRGQLDEGLAAYHKAIELRPEWPGAHNNLGTTLKDLGRLDEAIAAFRRALQLDPASASIHSNLIHTLHYHPDYNDDTIAEERRRWHRRFGEPPGPFIPPRASDRLPGRRLRIGYVSPDFRDHAVGRNLIPLFECHDRRDFEILCYSGAARADRLTEEFRRRAHQWRDTAGLSDEALAEIVRRDGVDILVDLSQHTAGNRLPMFARKPAPVQASFAGYPGSTGLEAIEHRISDRVLEAGSVNDGSGSKERVHVIDSFWCYEPCGIDVEVNGLPAGENGKVTFGCLNNFCKVNEGVLSLWARVLGKAPASRLILLASEGSHRQRTLETLGREGVEARRVEFSEARPRREYLELYHRLDVVLDTFPYNGHTTSLDALWMGVPVVSLVGAAPVSRAGLSQLSNLGLAQLAAHSEEDYVGIAVELAGDIPRLAQLRASLRARMKNSVLMDAPRFARQIEQAYREMWQERRAAPSRDPALL